MLSVPSIEHIAAQVQAPVYIYHGAQDPQVSVQWAEEDSHFFHNLQALRIFQNAGHAFAPLDGALGEVKTSGPFSEELLSALVSDVHRVAAQ
jgi:hypothetical protein